MTYFGSGICSYSRRTAGAILSVTVPLTTMRSAWRGPGANGMTPSRMKACRAMLAAMNSIAQQARPKLNTQRLERRPQLSTSRMGWGAVSWSRPTDGIGSATGVTARDEGLAAVIASPPPERATPGGVEQADGHDPEEHAHLDQRRPAELLHDRHPREQVDGVDREHHVEKRVEGVAHLGLRPAGT